MSKRIPLVYMVSRTALACRHWQDAQKTRPKFCRVKEDKNSETHPVWTQKGENGCVLGVGEECGRCGWVRKAGVRTNVNHITMQYINQNH